MLRLSSRPDAREIGEVLHAQHRHRERDQQRHRCGLPGSKTDAHIGSGLFFRLSPESFQLVVQRLDGDAENFGRTRLVVVRVRQRQLDQLPLRFVDRHARRQARPTASTAEAGPTDRPAGARPR